DVKVTYANTVDSDTAIRRLDVMSGFNLSNGKTNVTLAGAYAKSSLLTMGDRDFMQRGIAAELANNPNVFSATSFPTLGATTNIRSANGSPLFGAGTPSFTSVPVGYAGGGGLAPLQANAGRYNLDLASSAQLYTGKFATLYAPADLKSLSATVRHQFTPSFE